MPSRSRPTTELLVGWPRRQVFDNFVRAEAVRLGRSAVLLTGDRSDAEDLLQDALERTLRQWMRHDLGSLDGYVHRTMVNLVISRWRRHSRLSDRVHKLVRTTSATDEAVEPRLDMLHALGEVPPRQRAVLVLRYWEDRSESETAELLSCSIGTVKSQAARGLARLRREVASSYVPLTAELPLRAGGGSDAS